MKNQIFLLNTVQIKNVYPLRRKLKLESNIDKLLNENIFLIMNIATAHNTFVF